MNDNKRNGGIFAGKGYYIALVLCALAIGTGGYAVYRNTVQEIPAPTEETVEHVFPALAEEEEDIPVLATEGTRETPSEGTTQATQPKQKALKTMSPLSSGKEITEYSMETLSYNQTTRDWRVHDGIDIAAEAGTPVCAAAEGMDFPSFRHILLKGLKGDSASSYSQGPT